MQGAALLARVWTEAAVTVLAQAEGIPRTRQNGFSSFSWGDSEHLHFHLEGVDGPLQQLAVHSPPPKSVWGHHQSP